MAGNAPELRIIGSINKNATKDAIQRDLNKISKELKLTIGVDKSGNSDFTKIIKAKSQLINLEKTHNTQREKALQYEQKVRYAIAKNDQKEIDMKEKLTTQFGKLKNQAETAVYTVSKFGGKKHHDNISNLNNDFQKLNINQKMTSSEMKSVVTQADRLASGMKRVSSEARATGKNALKLGEMFKTAGKSFSVWMATTTLFFGSVRALQAGVQAVVELDKAMLELRKVTDITNEGIVEFINNAKGVGDGIGRTTTDVVRATSEFAKMGYTISESLRLGEDALILQNVGDGIEDVANATEILISTLKGFNMEAQDSRKILDSLNSVANAFALGTDDLAEGIKRAASVASVAGASFEQTLGMLTAMTEVSQNAEKSSTALKTLTMRLQGLSSEGESLGGNFTAKLNDSFESIAGVSITLDGKLRNIFDIVTDLGSKWQGLTREQQMYLAQESVGIRQAGEFVNLLTQYKTAIAATEVALNSQGSALEENAKYMDSISGKTQAFTSAVQNMWTSLISSDALKLVIEMGTELVKFTDNVGLLTIAFVAFMGILIKVNGLNAVLAFGLNMSSVAMGKLTLSSVLGTKAMTTLGLAMKAVPLIALAAGLIMVVNGISDANKATEAYNRTLEENKARISSIIYSGEIKELEDTVTALEKAQNAVIAYRKAVEFGGASKFGGGGVDKETTDEYKEAIDVLAEYGLKVDDVGGRLATLTARLKEKRSAEAASTAETRLNSQMLDDLRANVTDVVDIQETYSDLTQEIADGQKISGIELLNLIQKYPQLSKYMDENNQLLLTKDMLEKTVWQTEKEIAVKRMQTIKEEMVARQNSLKTLLADYETVYSVGSQLSGQSAAIFMQKISAARKEMEETTKSILEADASIKIITGMKLSDYTPSKTKESSSKSTSDKKDILSNFSAQEKAVSDLAYEMDILGKKTELAEGDDRIRLQEETLKKYEEQQEAVHQYSNAIRALIAKGGLSKEDLETLNNKLQDNGKEWWGIETAIKSLADTMANDLKKAQEDVLALQKENKDIVNELRESISKLVEEELKDQINSHKEAIESAKEELDIRLKQIDAEKELAGFSKDRADKESDIVKLASKINSLRVASEQGDMNATNQIITLEEERAKIQEELDELINDRSFDLRKEGLEAQYNEFEKTQNDEIKIIEDNLDDVAYMAKMVNEKINSSTETLFNDMIKYSSEYGTSFEADVIAKWEKALALIREYNSALQGGSGSFDFKDYNGGSAKDTVLDQMRSNKSLWTNASPEEKKRLNQANVSLGKSIGYSYKSSDGNYYSDSDGSKLVFDNGGRFNQGDTAIKANSTPEWINTDKQLQSLIYSGVSEFTQSLLSGAIPNIGGVQSNPSINVVINGSVDDKNINRITQELKNISTTVSQGQLDAMRGRGIKPSTRIR